MMLLSLYGIYEIYHDRIKSPICHSFLFPQLSLIASSFLAVNNWMQGKDKSTVSLTSFPCPSINLAMYYEWEWHAHVFATELSAYATRKLARMAYDGQTRAALIFPEMQMADEGGGGGGARITIIPLDPWATNSPPKGQEWTENEMKINHLELCERNPSLSLT